MVIGFPSLIHNIILEQFLNILAPTEVVGPSHTIACIHEKLFEGLHLPDMDLGKKKEKEKVFDMTAP